MFKRLLVAIDGSGTSMRGLEAAINLAGDQQAELHVMHVFFEHIMSETIAGETFVPAAYLEMPLVSGRAAGRRILEEACARVDERGLSFNPILVASRGHNVAHHILRQCRKLKADLIVMGTHGHHGLIRLVMGSDAENVVRDSTVPVLLVRDAVRPHRVTARSSTATTTTKPRRRASQPAATIRLAGRRPAAENGS